MLLMEEKELQNWEKTRKQGGIPYIIKTSLLSYLIAFSIYVITNGFLNLENIDKYISYNLAIWQQLVAVSIITLTALFLFAALFWKFNEKRYKATLEKNA